MKTDEEIKNIPEGFKPTSTTNYLLSDFNTVTKERTIYYDGAVPLHKIIDHLPDFFYTYLNRHKKDTQFFVSAICKPDGEQRPDTPSLAKFNSDKNRDVRIEIMSSVIKNIIHQFDHIFTYFIHDGRSKGQYRQDCSPNTIEKGYKEYINIITPKLKELSSS